MRNAQRAAALAVAGVLGGRNLSSALQDSVAVCGSLRGERAAAQALAYGTLRRLGFARFALARLAPRAPESAELAALLCVAIHQLADTEAAPYAVVHLAVENADGIGGRRIKSFANAILRSFLRQRGALLDAAHADAEARWSYPQWWIDRVTAELGPRAAATLEAGNLHPPMSLRVNRRRADVEQLHARLHGAGLSARALGPAALVLSSPVPVDLLPGFREGWVSVQDAGAQLTAPLLDLAPGQRVLDACAAPGGKAAHILELADVELIALDLDAQRLERVNENLGRLGLRARTFCADAGELTSWWDGEPFDRVLVDAPCSASGVVRRHPDIRWLRRPTDMAGFAKQQARLLDALWKVLRPGGKLLYATCSIFREENQERIEQFAARHSDARLLGGMPGEEGLLLPTREHDGFYHALLEKR